MDHSKNFYLASAYSDVLGGACQVTGLPDSPTVRFSASVCEFLVVSGASANGQHRSQDFAQDPTFGVRADQVNDCGTQTNRAELTPPSTINNTTAKHIVRRTSTSRHIDLNRPGFLRLAEVLEIIPVSRASWYVGIQRRLYPAPVSLGGGRAVGWTTASIKKLIEDLTAGRIQQKGGAKS